MKNFQILFLFLVLSLLVACSSEPKVIEGEAIGDGGAGMPVFSDVPGVQGAGASGMASPVDGAEHKVTALETLDTDRYSYVRVKENEEEYWIAVMKREIKVGGTYYFAGGILKQNFQSQEYNRVFERLYLVSDFREQSGAGGGQVAVNTQTASDNGPVNVTPAAGAIKIADLVANISKYDGKVVKVTGKCVKVNPMIMGRNWIHLKDGSGKEVDLTVTTVENITPGMVVTLEGTIALNKDFGAGYKYDYIMESAVVVK